MPGSRLLWLPVWLPPPGFTFAVTVTVAFYGCILHLPSFSLLLAVPRLGDGLHPVGSVLWLHWVPLYHVCPRLLFILFTRLRLRWLVAPQFTYARIGLPIYLWFPLHGCLNLYTHYAPFTYSTHCTTAHVTLWVHDTHGCYGYATTACGLRLRFGCWFTVASFYTLWLLHYVYIYVYGCGYAVTRCLFLFVYLWLLPFGFPVVGCWLRTRIAHGYGSGLPVTVVAR